MKSVAPSQNKLPLTGIFLILLSTVYDHCFLYSFATSWDFTYISFTYNRFYLSGSTCRSQFEIEFGKNSKTYACVLKKNLSHLAGLDHLQMFIWQIFISPRRDPGKIKRLFIWKWAGPVRRAGWPRWDLTFFKKLV